MLFCRQWKDEEEENNDNNDANDDQSNKECIVGGSRAINKQILN